MDNNNINNNKKRKFNDELEYFTELKYKHQKLSSTSIDKLIFDTYVKVSRTSTICIPTIKNALNITNHNNENTTYDNDNDILKTLKNMKKFGITYYSSCFNTFNKFTTIEDEIHMFMNKFTNAQNVFIDGLCATGKSTLAKYFTNIKISQYLDISNSYNYHPTSALSYVLLNILMNEESEGLIIDRSPLSNIAFQICYYIMGILTNDDLGYRTLSAICQEYIDNHNMLPVLEYIKNKNLNILIILDSDFIKASKRLNLRGYYTNSISDKQRSLVKEYWLGQMAAFSYLSNMLHIPCFDINYFRIKYKKNDDENLLQEIYLHINNFLANNMNFKNIKKPTLNHEGIKVHTDHNTKSLLRTLVISKR
uniref:Uncharacterized protein n=1 Tax=Faxonius propinquus nudivirus TaxID=3139431 RepID=A0AAU8GFG2_9VIRU